MTDHDRHWRDELELEKSPPLEPGWFHATVSGALLVAFMCACFYATKPVAALLLAVLP